MLLGDAIHLALARVGVTEERVQAWIGRGCNCGRRRQRLNELHAWAARVLSGEDVPPMHDLTKHWKGDAR